MNKYVKISLITVFGLLALVLAAFAYIAATFNPNDYKPLIVKLVQEKKQRTLNIEGDIKLAFWPKLGADLGRISLSEHKGDQEFAAIESAKVYVAVMPLLAKKLVIDTVRIDGVKANIVRFKDGTTNFDDLLSKEESSEQIQFDIDGIIVSNSAIKLHDEMGARDVNLSDLQLTAGRVALNQPLELQTSFAVKASNPAVDAKVQFKGTLLSDNEHKQYGAKGLDVAVQGKLALLNKVDFKLQGNVEAKPEQNEFTVDGLKLALKGEMAGEWLDVALDAPRLMATRDEVSGKEATLVATRSKGEDTLTANLRIADLKGSLKAFQSSGISGDVSGKLGPRTLAGKFSSPFQGNLEARVFDLPKLVGNIDVKDPALPNGAMKATFNFNVHADLKQQQANAVLDIDVDGSKLKGNVAVAGFSPANVKFDFNVGQLDLNKLLGPKKEPAKDAGPAKPADLSALKSVLAQGNLKVGNISYDKYRISNLAASLKADGQVFNVSSLSLKFDDSQIKGGVGISHFDKPRYNFDLDIDNLDVDKYVTKSEPAAKPATGSDAPIDLSALKALNADGDLRVGALKVANIKSSNVHLGLKASDGLVALAPFSANLYEGSMAGSLNVDARAVPVIALQQEMKGIAIGPLLVDAINNDMLEGKGTLSVEVKTQGATVGALKKALNGNAAINLADGAVKGIDIAGTIRDIKNKLRFNSNTLGKDNKKKSDFSEMSASFKITNGVAHNEDLSMKSPLLRVAGSGDIDIGNEKLNYTAKPTVVASLKGQGGSDIGALNGLTFLVKVTGSFADPKYGFDFAAIGLAIAQKNLLGNVAGSKGEAVGKLLSGDKAGALEGLVGGSKSATTTDNTGQTTQQKPTPEDKVKKKLNKLLGL